MDKKYLRQNLQNSLTNIFHKSYLKKACAGILICGLLAAGGTWYHHTQKQIEHAQLLQARTTMIEAQANQNNVALLDLSNIRSLTAQAIGIDENAITFREISLSEKKPYPNNEHEKMDSEGKGHAAKKELKESPSPEDYANLPAEQAVSSVPAFQPVYKVACRANKIRYSLYIDAITGKILHSNVGKNK